MSIVYFSKWRIQKSDPWTAIAKTSEHEVTHRHFGDEKQAREWAKSVDPSRCRKVGSE